MTSPLQNELPQHITDLVADGALFVVNHSGGKDSQAMFAYITRHVPAEQIVVVHADLGRVEWAGVQDHIRANIGAFDLNVVRADKDLLEMVRRRHAKLQADGKDAAPWPSAQHRQCTSDLKRGPIAKFTRHYVKASGHRLVVNCLGLRAEESARRAKRADFRTVMRECTRTRTVVEWLPIQAWTLDNVWQAIEESGQRRHWAYDRGATRLSCCFCILASKADLTLAAQENPDLYREYVELERETGYTMRADASLEEITGVAINAEPAAAVDQAPRQVVLGTPINPAALLDSLAGYSFCVSYASRAKLGSQVDRIIDLINADPNAFLLVDNGAFTHWRQGGAMTDDYVAGFEAWAEDILARCPKAIAVLPDVIGGAPAENWDLVCTSSLDPARSMPIWHLHEPLDYLRHMVESGFPMIGFGSSGDYASGRGAEWEARIAQAFAVIDAATAAGSGYARPHIHMMRCQSQLHRFPFNSADSTNVAINHNKHRPALGEGRARFLADRIRARCDEAGPVPAEWDVWAEAAAAADLSLLTTRERLDHDATDNIDAGAGADLAIAFWWFNPAPRRVGIGAGTVRLRPAGGAGAGLRPEMDHGGRYRDGGDRQDPGGRLAAQPAAADGSELPPGDPPLQGPPGAAGPPGRADACENASPAPGGAGTGAGMKPCAAVPCGTMTADRSMTGDEFAQLLADAGLRQVDVGRLVAALSGMAGPDNVTVNRYVHGRLPPPATLVALIRLYARQPKRIRDQLLGGP